MGHVVQENVKLDGCKMYLVDNARVDPLFCSLSLLFSDGLVTVALQKGPTNDTVTDSAQTR